jgi:hypothetical protein
MNIETETMKQWAESVSKAHDLLVWGHHLRVKEILQEVRDNIRIAVEEADATPPAAQTVTCNGMPAYEGSLSAAQPDRSYTAADVLEAHTRGYELGMKQQPAPVQEPVGDEWTPCMKLPVVVHVRKQRHGESHVSTREGITPVKPDDLIMRGVSGEEYPIGRAIFEQTYTLDTTPPAAQRKPLTNEQIVQKAKVIGGLFDDLAVEYQTDDIIKFGREMEAAHNIKE